MAIRTGDVFKGLKFDGQMSKWLGVYITGEAVYNAPTRRVNMIQIPGRQGLFAQDEGTFNNITVAYPAGMFDRDQQQFAATIAQLRTNYGKAVGYKRLEDDYNPDEYRMAIFKDGLEVEPIDAAGTFTLTFECKPQRWLKSGETYTTATSLTNPTQFPASPIFRVQGYGTIQNNGELLATVQNNPIGNLLLWPGFSHTQSPTAGAYNSSVPLQNFSLLNSGDTITLAQATFNFGIDTHGATIQSVTVSNETGTTAATITTTKANSTANVAVTFENYTVAANTSSTIAYETKEFDIEVVFNPGSQVWRKSVWAGVGYADNDFVYRIAGGADPGNITVTPSIVSSDITGYSTQTVSDTLYLDLETGLAWYDINGEKIDANNLVVFPLTLGTLGPGTNTITKSNTFTSFETAPRWWKI